MDIDPVHTIIAGLVFVICFCTNSVKMIICNDTDLKLKEPK